MKITKQDIRIQISSNKAWCIFWYKNKLRHREDGPASIWNNGNRYVHIRFRLRGIHYYPEEYYAKIRPE